MMDQKTEVLNSWRKNIFFFSLVFASVVFPFSEALISISSGLLLFQALVLQSWRHPSVKNRSRGVVFFPVSVFVVYLIGVTFTKDFSFALYELKKVIFWVVIPLSIFLSPKLSARKIYVVLLVFIASVTVSSFIIAGKLIITDHWQSQGFRSIGYISHIRFSFQVILALVLLAWFFFRRKYLKLYINPSLVFFIFLWLVCFLFLLKSLLGIISFFGTLGVALILHAGKVKGNRWKIILSVAFLIIIFVPAYFTGKVLRDFYDFKEVDSNTVETRTISGNRYHHDFEERTRENGYLVYVYICDDELRKEWNKRSKMEYDELLNGFPLSITLIRYLTSLGYRKDSAGVSKLNAKDISLIKEGVTNFKFGNRYFSIYPRIYETIWEVDYYLRTGDPNNKSLAQRFEFVKASLILIKRNPLFGIGTGNWVLKYNEVYDKMETRLTNEKWGPSHNQYLNYMVKFGIIGFAWIFFAVLFPFFRSGHRYNFIFVLFLISYAFANFGDANMETHIGLSFFIFFYSLFLWNSTGEMRKFILK